MRAVLRIAACLFTLGLLSACIDAIDPESAVARTIISEHVRAFNAGDVEADWNVNVPYVSVTETANWTATDGTKKSQSSMTVYELEDNLIRRVWYYPAVDK